MYLHTKDNYSIYNQYLIGQKGLSNNNNRLDIDNSIIDLDIIFTKLQNKNLRLAIVFNKLYFQSNSFINRNREELIRDRYQFQKK